MTEAGLGSGAVLRDAPAALLRMSMEGAAVGPPVKPEDDGEEDDGVARVPEDARHLSSF